MSRSSALSAPASAVLAIDSGSPVVSVAFGSATTILASRSMAISHSSEALLRGIDEVLDEAGAKIGDVDGLLGLRGPGSFTGLRVGLATLLGLHQALGVRATAVPTLEVLSLVAGSSPAPVAAVVDAMRDEWFVQLFAGGRALGPAVIRPTATLADLDVKRLVGHGVEVLRPELGGNFELVAAAELAPLALQLLARSDFEWSTANLLDPLYLRPPAIHSR